MPLISSTLGSLRSYDGNCNENVTLKWNVRLSALGLFLVGHVYKIAEVPFHLIDTNGFHVRGKEWMTYCCGLALSSEPQIWKFHVVIWLTTSKNCTTGRAARTARFFFLIQPIKSLIYDVVVAVAVVTCSTILFPHSTNQIIDLWRGRRCCRSSFVNSLISKQHDTWKKKTVLDTRLDINLVVWRRNYKITPPELSLKMILTDALMSRNERN